MNIFKKLASFVLLTSLVCLSVLCNAAPSHAQTNEEAISYDAATKTLTIQGDCDTDQIHDAVHDSGEAASLETLHFAGTPTITTKQMYYSGPFENCASLKYITADEDAHVSFAGNGSANPTLQYFFFNCTNLISLDGLSTWDVSNVSGVSCMDNMFFKCVGLTSLDGLSAWDVSRVTGRSCMTNMFFGCIGLTSLDALSAWDVSNVSGGFCMNGMFSGCIGLTSLDALSAWDVSNVSGQYCMEAMFSNCSNLICLEGLSNWNIDKVQSDLKSMFLGCTSLTSLTVGVFKLNSNMQIPTSFSDNINTWWPEKGTTAGISTTDLYVKSQDTDTYGNRWVRSATNPYTNADDANIVWDVISKPYTGYNFRIGPTSVTLGGTNLKEGIDYYVLYTKEGSQKAYPVVREEGAYTANLYFQGKYLSSNSPFYTQTVYVGDAPDPTPSLTDGWHQSDAGWRYAVDGAYVTGWLWIDDTYGAHWYYFNEDTYMAASQWQWDEENSSWYWLCSSGPMIRGLWQWINNEWYGFWWNGKMCRGWVWDVDWQAWFYCYNNGIMARNAWEGPYWLNREGIWVR